MKTKCILFWMTCLTLLFHFNVNGQNHSVNELIKLYETETSDSVKIEILLDISNKYSKDGNYEQAYEFYQKYILFQDSIENINHQNLLLEARLKYESDKTEKELELLEKDNELNKMILRKRNLITYSLIGFICFIIIVTVLLIQINRIKTGQEIAILTQRNLLQQLNPNFIIETVNSIQHSLFQQKKESTNQYLSKFSKLMRLLLDNSQFQQIHLQNEIEMIDLYLNLQKLKSKDDLEYMIDVDLTIDSLELKVPSFILLHYLQKIINGKVLINKEIIVKIYKAKKSLLCSIFEYYRDNRDFVKGITENRAVEFVSKLKRSKFSVKNQSKKNVFIEQSVINNLNKDIGNIYDISIPLNITD